MPPAKPKGNAPPRQKGAVPGVLPPRSKGSVKQHKVCGGATPPCCYTVYSTSVEGTVSTCCARYRSRGECRLIGQQEFNPELLGHKIYSKILDKNNKFYYR